MDGGKDCNEKLDLEREKLTRKIKEEITPGCYIKSRHVLAFMLFTGMFSCYSMRVNLNVAIVAMVNSTRNVEMNVSNACPDRGASDIGNRASNGEFEWDYSQQGLVLGCYYYGYIVTCLPGGYLSSRLGVKPLLGFSVLLSSIMTVLTPTLAHVSFPALVAARIMVGFLQGVSFPAVLSAWGRWAPPDERSKLVAISFAGSGFGAFITQLISGVVADHVGWPAIFYITGGLSFLWSLAWFGIIHSWPREHPRISIQEKTYIVESIGVDHERKSGIPATPWFSIFTSIHVWAIYVGHFSVAWGAYTLMTMLPTYMATVLRFSLTQTGGLSALPYILHFILSIVVGYITDEFRRRDIISTTHIRKLNTFLGCFVPAVLIVLAGYVGCDVAAAMVLFTLGVSFGSLTVAGCECNAVDLAPMFGGILFGISNTIANVSGFLAPQLAGMMLQNDGSINQWRNIFWVSAAVYILGAVFYLVFGSGEEQPWAKGKKIQNKDRVQYAVVCKEEASPSSSKLEGRS